MVKSRSSNVPKARLDAFIELQQEETLHLEFKTLASDSTLTRDDRKLIAKAICGLSNAEGGQLVIGIETKKIDGVDVAFRKKPLAGIGRLKRLVSSIMPEVLSPQNRGITVNTVIDDARGDLGSLLIDVPSSQDRPHMSVPERRYFRRGSCVTSIAI